MHRMYSIFDNENKTKNFGNISIGYWPLNGLYISIGSKKLILAIRYSLVHTFRHCD